MGGVPSASQSMPAPACVTVCVAFAGVHAFARLLYVRCDSLVEGAMHALTNLARVSPSLCRGIAASVDAIPRTVHVLVGAAPPTTHGAAAALLHVLASQGGDVWDGEGAL